MPSRQGGIGRLLAKLPASLFEILEILYNPFTALRLSVLFRRFRPDLIYERYSLYLCATVWLAKRAGIPIVLEINDSAAVERVRPLHFRRLALALERWCFRNCTGLVFISSYFRNQANRIHGDIAPSVISPNAADTARFNPSLFSRGELRQSHGLDADVVCGYVGAFVYWHGVSDFVRLAAHRIRENPRLKLLLVGDGVELESVRQLVAEQGLSDRILLPGRVPHARIPEWIACMDFAVLPNSNEYGSPMKLFELMAMEVAVVAPDYEPIAEVIDDGKTGWLFRKGDLDQCVASMLELSLKPEALEVAGKAARQYIIEQRQWKNNAMQMLDLVERRGNHAR